MASTATLLTRRQVAALLSEPEADIKARDGKTFRPTKGSDGGWRYDPAEVAAVLRGTVVGDDGVEPAGAVCAAAFELFQAGKKLPDVVILLKQPPAIVRGLRAEYDAMAATITVSTESVALLERSFRASVRDEATLARLIASIADQLRAEHERGYQAGLADAADLGEIVDPETGEKRPLTPADAINVVRAVDKTWAETTKDTP